MIFHTSFLLCENNLVIVNWYGIDLNIKYDFSFEELNSALDIEEPYPQRIDYISEELDDLQIQSLINTFSKISKEYRIHGYSYFLLNENFVNAILHDFSKDKKTIFLWYLLKSAGYHAILLHNENDDIYLYGGIGQNVHNTNKVTVDGIQYITIFEENKKLEKEKLFLYNKNNDKLRTSKLFDVDKSNLPIVGESVVNNKIEFIFKGNKFCYSYKLNKHIVDYYEAMPDIDWDETYINYEYSVFLRSTLLPLLQKDIVVFSEVEKIQFLLSFVQKGIKYKEDSLVDNNERWMFPEESLMVGIADCEDKSILFASLVKKILGINSILLFYDLKNDLKDHVNIAINVRNSISSSGWESVFFKGKDYVVCETSGEDYGIGENIKIDNLPTPLIYPLFSDKF